METIRVRRMPHLDESGWSAWWINDGSGETLEWRYGHMLRVSTSIAGVSISGSAFFSDEESRQTFSIIVRLAQHGVEILRRRHGRKSDTSGGDRSTASEVEGGEEPDASTTLLSAWQPAQGQVH